MICTYYGGDANQSNSTEVIWFNFWDLSSRDLGDFILPVWKFAFRSPYIEALSCLMEEKKSHGVRQVDSAEGLQINYLTASANFKIHKWGYLKLLSKITILVIKSTVAWMTQGKTNRDPCFSEPNSLKLTFRILTVELLFKLPRTRVALLHGNR